MEGTNWPLKQLLLLQYGPFQTSSWQECACYISRPSVIHHPSATLPWAPRTHSSKEEAAVFRREQQFRREWGHCFRLDKEKNNHTTSIKKTATTWSAISQCPVLCFWHRDSVVEFVKWNYTSRRTEKTSSYFKMDFASVAMLAVCPRQLEVFVIPEIDATSLRAHPGATKPCCFITGHVSISCLAHSVQLTKEYSSAKILLDVLKYEEYVWEVIGNNKMVAFLMGLWRSFIKFPYYFGNNRRGLPQ